MGNLNVIGQNGQNLNSQKYQSGLYSCFILTTYLVMLMKNTMNERQVYLSVFETFRAAITHEGYML